MIYKFITDSWKWSFEKDNAPLLIVAAIGIFFFTVFVVGGIISWSLELMAIRITLVSLFFALLPCIVYYLHLRSAKETE